ncbi:DUF2294 domain-containing protein [Candidatus Roizmanbacteria bacterium]|nr:DUF2294 domain-containing protein [Candidatus Roizmanbacteria bacterium]
MEKRTQGQVEDAITKMIVQFYVDNLKVGPKEAKTYILDDMVIVRLKGNLLPIEKKLLEGKDGIELVKNIRQALHEITTKHMMDIVTQMTGHKVISAHSDVSTKTGEMVKIFVLDENLEKKLTAGSL